MKLIAIFISFKAMFIVSGFKRSLYKTIIYKLAHSLYNKKLH